MSDVQQTPRAEETLSEEQLSELLRIRRDKLTALQEAGKDPFVITHYAVE